MSTTPERFLMSIGGFMGPSYSVEWIDGRLKYESTREGRSKSRVSYFEISSEAWRTVLAVLEQAKVWNWKASYHCDALDGTSWSLEVAWGEKAIRSTGSNAYPAQSDEQEESWNPSANFEQLLQAISRLVKGRAFE